MELAGGGPLEKVFVLGIGARPPALDVLDAEMVELLGDPQLVVDRERQAFLLTAIPQGGVVDVDGVGELPRQSVVVGVSRQPTYSTQSL